MRYLLVMFFFILIGISLKGQSPAGAKEGTISFITSQNVYVKFQSTGNIVAGDTLFIMQDSKLFPVLIVRELSSISCVCTLIASNKLSLADKIIALQKKSPPKLPVAQSGEQNVPAKATRQDTVAQTKKETVIGFKQAINGRISFSSYSAFSNSSDFSHRTRTTFSMNAKNMGDSRMSAEIYVSYVHNLKDKSEFKNDVFHNLKIYSLALNYEFNKNNTIWVGRKINPRLSNAGAIDGVQYENRYKSITTGVFAGTRPDYVNYGFNSKLFQFGGYVGHDYNSAAGNMQSSLAFVEQRNSGNTDRRFAYFQHSNALIPNLYFFGSAEFDLYKKVMNTQDSTYKQDNSANLSNVYVSLRFRIMKPWSVSLSYSARHNIIYYETYKNIVDQLLEAATMKGFILQTSIRPAKNISIGATAGYRYSKTDTKPSTNLYTYLTVNNVPGINATATLSATLLATNYTKGSIYSLGMSRDLIAGKLSGEMNYRYVRYKFTNAAIPLIQHMADFSLTWRPLKIFMMSLNFEESLEKGRNVENVYINLTRRF